MVETMKLILTEEWDKTFPKSDKVNHRTVAREENMTRAAEFLHITQPTLSKSLKSLEDELGKNAFIQFFCNLFRVSAGDVIP